MKLQVGDTVRYLNEVGGGVVKRIISNSMVEIVDDSGFEIPVMEHELLCIEKATDIKGVHTEQQISIPKPVETVEIEGNDEPHFFIAFTHVPKQSNLFDIYIINDCNYHANYVVSYKKVDSVEFVETGLLESNTKVCVNQISYEELSVIQDIHIQLLLYKNTTFEYKKPIEIIHRLQTVKFYKPGVFVVNDFFEEDAYVIDVYRESKQVNKGELDIINLERLMSEKISADKSPELPINQTVGNEPILQEVDLHIHELIDSEQGLDAAAKLEIQLQTFEKELAKALQSKFEKIVFIHGVGNGVLKAKIRGILDRDFPYLFYQDASFQKYKFGATLVYLKRLRK